jgi:hypothetical protein
LGFEKNSVLCVEDPEAAIAYGSALFLAAALNEERFLSAAGYGLGAKLGGNDLETVENLVTVRLNKLADRRFYLAHVADVHGGRRA